MFQEIPLPFSFQMGSTMVTGISTFSIMLVVAFLIGSWLIPRELVRRGLIPEHADWAILLAVVGAIVGSKVGFVFEVWDQIWFVDKSFGDTLYHVLFKWDGMRFKYPENKNIIGMWATLFNGAGLVFYGGFVVSFGSIYIYLRKMNLPVWQYGDAFMPALALGYAIGRLGCLVSGDGCYGHAAGVNIPGLTMVYGPLDFLVGADGVRKWNTPVQSSLGVNVWNTPVMEAIASTILFVIYMKWARFKGFRPGMLVAIFLMWNGLARFSVEFLRLNDAVIPILQAPEVSVAARYTKNGLENWHWYGITQSQLVALTIFSAGALWIYLGKLYITDGPKGSAANWRDQDGDAPEVDADAAEPTAGEAKQAGGGGKRKKRRRR